MLVSSVISMEKKPNSCKTEQLSERTFVGDVRFGYQCALVTSSKINKYNKAINEMMKDQYTNEQDIFFRAVSKK